MSGGRGSGWGEGLHCPWPGELTTSGRGVLSPRLHPFLWPCPEPWPASWSGPPPCCASHPDSLQAREWRWCPPSDHSSCVPSYTSQEGENHSKVKELCEGLKVHHPLGDQPKDRGWPVGLHWYAAWCWGCVWLPCPDLPLCYNDQLEYSKEGLETKKYVKENVMYGKE